MNQLENTTLHAWLRHHADTRPTATALVDAKGEVSYAELSAAVSRLTSAFAQLGIAKGDVVAAQLPNLRAYVVAFLATSARGAVFQTLHMPYRQHELRDLLQDSGAKTVILGNLAPDSRTQDVLSVKPDLPDLQHVIVAGDAPESCHALSDLMQTEPNPADVVTTQADDPYLLLYTSGTTARPKGVPHKYRGFLNNALSAATQMQIAPDDRVLSLAAMTHLYGLFTLHLSLASGAASVLMPAFNPKTVLGDLKTARASHVFSAPAHFSPFVANSMLKPQDFAGIRYLCLSGAPVPSALAHALDTLMPDGGVAQLWGMSELQAGTYTRPGDPASMRCSTAGRPAPGTALRVLDDQCSPLPVGHEGALQVRGPSVFDGYLNRADETRKSFDAQGWFATGDLAVINPDGFLTITGRTKELINRGGVKFNPVEVEEVLAKLPTIQNCAIVPIPDPDLGERACLCVELAPDADLSLDQVLEALDQAGMAKYKWPETLKILPTLPMTPTRKVMRGKLVEMIETPAH